MNTSGKSRRGFASMSPALRRAIASMGGKTAHALGRAHVFTTAEAVVAGSKGGKASHAKGTAHRFTSAEARQAGRKGGPARARRKWGAYVRPTCLSCEVLSKARSLCCICYSRRASEVRRGKTTWTQLDRAGLARPLSSARAADGPTPPRQG
jgi:hypothetical protein